MYDVMNGKEGDRIRITWPHDYGRDFAKWNGEYEIRGKKRNYARIFSDEPMLRVLTENRSHRSVGEDVPFVRSFLVAAKDYATLIHKRLPANKDAEPWWKG